MYSLGLNKYRSFNVIIDELFFRFHPPLHNNAQSKPSAPGPSSYLYNSNLCGHQPLRRFSVTRARTMALLPNGKDLVDLIQAGHAQLELAKGLTG